MKDAIIKYNKCNGPQPYRYIYLLEKMTVIRCNVCIFELKMIVWTLDACGFIEFNGFFRVVFFFLLSKRLAIQALWTGLDDKSRRRNNSPYKFIDHIADICVNVPAEDSCFVVSSYLFVYYNTCAMSCEVLWSKNALKSK